MSVILGLNAFHPDSAACLLIDGKLVGAVAEERLGERIKHSSRFPESAIRWLLTDNGLVLSDVTHVALSRETKANRLAKLRWVAGNPVKGIFAAREHMARKGAADSMIGQLSSICDIDSSIVKFQTVYVEHHIAHIASAYYCSPFDGLTAGVSYDGSGDFASAMAARCEGTKLEVLDRVTLPDSLGFFYSALCQFIGFDRFGEEYKVMGLAPYGEDRYADEMKNLLKLPNSGWFELGKGYFRMPGGGENGAIGDNGQISIERLYDCKMTELLGKPATRDGVTQREKDIARSVQVRFEEAAVHCVNRLHSLVPSEQLVMAGGCALNGVANARLMRDTGFSKPYLQAAASDDGTCLGAALWAWHNVVGGKERFHMQHAFWGPEYSHERMRSVVNSVDETIAVSEMLDLEEVTNVTAKYIADGSVVGWYQGRSEWGPRALGNRSILANPAIPTMKETINRKIKRRESFRPFAPSVLKEDVGTYFEQNIYSPFMMHVVTLRHEWRDQLPAITHIDGTGRLQSVEKESNPLYHALITAVKKHTGVGMVLNTSFNENEPVVDTPEQALNCFLRNDLDVLCLGRFVLVKRS